MPWRAKTPDRSPPFVGAHRKDGAGSSPVSGPASSHFSYYRQPCQPEKVIETSSLIVNPFDSQKVETAWDNAETVMLACAPRTAPALVCASGKYNGRGRERRAWNADDQERMGSYFLGVFQIRIWIARVRRTQSAAVLRALLARCWNSSS